MRRLPWGDARADAVVCADNALPHLLAHSDVVAALRQMNRVLRPDGRRTTTYRAYTRATLSELATGAGFQDIRWHTPVDTNFFQPVMTAHSPT